MNKQQGGDPKKEGDRSIIDGASLVFSNSLYKRQNEIIKRLGEKVGTNATLQYMNVNDNRGGNYNHKTNTITVTNNAFRYNNIYDVMSVIEHEVIHQKDKGVVTSFKDHVRVYKEQAKSPTFEKTSKEFKSSHAVATAQRILSGYVNGDYDSKAMELEIDSYNKLNSGNKLKPIWGGNSESTVIKIHNEIIRYDKEITPSS